MTVEKRHSITLDEMSAVQFQCKNCGVLTVFPIGKKISLEARCPHCPNQWFAPTPEIMGNIGVSLENFIAAIPVIIEQATKIGVIFSIQIKGEENGERE